MNYKTASTKELIRAGKKAEHEIMKHIEAGKPVPLHLALAHSCARGFLRARKVDPEKALGPRPWETRLKLYVGKTVILQKTKYGELDGVRARIIGTIRIQWGSGKKEVLLAETEHPVITRAIVLPSQFRQVLR